MRRPAIVWVFALLVLHPGPVSSQFLEAECSSSWPGFPFAEGIFLERGQRSGLDTALREFAARDAMRGGTAPAGSAAWTWHSDLSAVARSSDLGVFISRFNRLPRRSDPDVTDGYVVSAWAFVDKGTRKLIANTWLNEKNDRRPLRPPCGLRIVRAPGGVWSSAPAASEVREVAAAVPPSAGLREADNALIAAATCRSRWPSIIAAAGEDQGRFLLPGAGEVIGGANLRAILDQLPDEPVRWKRVKFLASRDGKLGVSIGRLVNCDDSKLTQAYVTAWIRDGASWRLELLAIAP